MNIFGKSGKARPASFVMLLLMLLAFSLKAFLPAGFMPEVKDGAMQIVICSGATQKVISIPDGDADHTFSAGERCPYQVLTSAKLLSAPPVLFFHEERVVAAPGISSEQPIPVYIHAYSVEARGPPSIS